MTNRDLTILGYKITALTFFVFSVISFFSLPLLWEHSREAERQTLMIRLSGHICLAIFCIFLWFYAEKMASRYSPKSSDGNTLVINATLFPNIVAFVGVFLLVVNIIPLFYNVSNYVSFTQLKNISPDLSVASSVAQIALAFWLFFDAQRISKWLQSRLAKSEEGKVLLEEN